MRVLHVASFNGNVGDNANHNGLRHELSSVLPADTEYHNLEMRRLYQNYAGPNPLRFDNSFAELANTYDMVVFGGGNFFEVWLESSETGCTLDLPPSVLDRIKTRMVFFGLGFDTYKGYSTATLKKFRRFLEALLSHPSCLVSVRNDGSKKQLRQFFGRQFEESVMKVPDGGFFMEAPASTLGSHLPPRGREKVMLCLAQDMMAFRLPGLDEREARSFLIESFSSYVRAIYESRPGSHMYFMPHIYSDLQLIADVVNELPDHVRRNAVSVGPCISGPGAEQVVFSNYSGASVVVSMRFHGNVVPMGFGVPTIGVSTYKKIADLYDEVGLTDWCIQAADDSFDDELLQKTEELAQSGGPRDTMAERRHLLRAQMDHFVKALSKLLS